MQSDERLTRWEKHTLYVDNVIPESCPNPSMTL
jgi:hypothetical protein